MKFTPRIILVIFLAMFFSSLHAAEYRWYSDAQVAQGQAIFQENCASCHGVNAESIAASGDTKAAPALDGTAHAWHHSNEQLKKTISMGSIQLGGTMPAFSDKLAEADIDNVIAFFQSKWPEETYVNWSQRFDVKSGQPQVADITELLKLRLGTDDVSPAVETGIEGVYQTQFGDKYAYLIDGGRYVFIGDLVDLKHARNLTEISRRDDVKKVIEQVPASDTIIFPAQGIEKTVLNVFTDTSCAYCQKLHKEVGYLQEAGITVRYFAFPRGGNRGPGYQDLKSVWCAKDQLEAMSIAKGVKPGKLGAGDCEKADSVDRGFAMGRKIGISGTPALFSAVGTKFNGYVPYNDLIPMLLNEL